MMSHHKGLKGLLSGIMKKPAENPTDQKGHKDSNSKSKYDEDTSMPDAPSSPGPSGDANTTAEERRSIPIRSLKRKTATTLVLRRPGSSKGKDSEKEATPIPETPNSPSESEADHSSASSDTSANTSEHKRFTRPRVHFFLYQTSLPSPRRGPKMPEYSELEVVIQGFNDDITYHHIHDTKQRVLWTVPFLFMSDDDILYDDVDDPTKKLTFRGVSGYVAQTYEILDIAHGELAGPTPEQAARDAMPGLTLGRLTTTASPIGRVKFTMLPDDLVVLQRRTTEDGVPADDCQLTSSTPWASPNFFPFAHEDHFHRTSLKHFAFEWDEAASKKGSVMRPVSATPGVTIWLIDYEIERRHPRSDKAVREDRFVFCGPGVRFIEARLEDKEWKDRRWSRRFGARQQVKNWHDTAEMDEVLEWDGKQYDYVWPSVGALACEVGDF